jgi:hypothetical protein
MHECWECGTMCDCDGEDMDQPQPDYHVCINPQCGGDDDNDDMGPQPLTDFLGDD